MTDAELIALLRDERVTASRTETADRIEALIAERDALQAWKRYWSGEYDTVLAGRADEYDRAEAAEANLAKAVEALELTVRADNLRETYHALPNDRNRIGDKKSRKSIARDAWLRAFRKASSTARATLAEIKGESHE